MARDMERKRELDRERQKRLTATGARVPDSVRALTMTPEQLAKRAERYRRSEDKRRMARAFARVAAMSPAQYARAKHHLDDTDPGWDQRACPRFRAQE